MELQGAGTSTSGLAFGGNVPPQTGITEYWDGTSWTEVADLAARGQLGGAGISSTSSIAFGGNTAPFPANSSATEEWIAPDVVINTLTTS
jgi:hypothetical protein